MNTTQILRKITTAASLGLLFFGFTSSSFADSIIYKTSPKNKHRIEATFDGERLVHIRGAVDTCTFDKDVSLNLEDNRAELGGCLSNVELEWTRCRVKKVYTYELFLNINGDELETLVYNPLDLQ